MSFDFDDGYTLEFLGLWFPGDDRYDLGEEGNAWHRRTPTEGRWSSYRDIADGMAVYKLTRPDYTSIPVHQAFREGSRRPEGEGLNVWGWDGDRDEPTLNPSFGYHKDPDGRGWLIHLFLRNGCIEPCSDMLAEVVR